MQEFLQIAAANQKDRGELALLDHDFSVQIGELTPTLKVKRNAINDHYEDLVATQLRGSSSARSITALAGANPCQSLLK